MLAGEQPEQAIERFKRELQRVADRTCWPRSRLPSRYIKRSEFAEAKPWAEQAVQEAPTQFIAHNALGQVLLATGDVDGAVRALEAARQAGPATARRCTSRWPAPIAPPSATADADREQAEFTRLDRLVRQQRTGDNSVGGSDAPPR